MPNPTYHLTPDQVADLLYELCVKLGFCLPPTDQRRLEKSPPTDIESFLEAVFLAEGMDPKVHENSRKHVHSYISKHFLPTLQTENHYTFTQGNFQITATTTRISPTATHYALFQDTTPLTFSKFLHLLHTEAEFRSLSIDLLSSSLYRAFRWETPPLTTATANRPFEFVLFSSPVLQVEQDPSPFAEHFRNAPPASAITFPNLAGDSLLVVPTPDHEKHSHPFAHFADFMRHASPDQKQTLLHLLAETTLRRINSQPVWLSTAGAAVPWLHIRLDNRPKYYAHLPYRTVP